MLPTRVAAYLAVGSWVVPEVLLLIAEKLAVFGGGSGTRLPLSIAPSSDECVATGWRRYIGAVLIVDLWNLARMHKHSFFSLPDRNAVIVILR